MQIHFLFVLRKLLAWLFALLSTLLPHHLLVQVPESERCLVPQEASLMEAPSARAPAEAVSVEAVAPMRKPDR